MKIEIIEHRKTSLLELQIHCTVHVPRLKSNHFNLLTFKTAVASVCQHALAITALSQNPQSWLFQHFCYPVWLLPLSSFVITVACRFCLRRFFQHHLSHLSPIGTFIPCVPSQALLSKSFSLNCFARLQSLCGLPSPANQTALHFQADKLCWIPNWGVKNRQICLRVQMQSEFQCGRCRGEISWLAICKMCCWESSVY